MVTKKTVLVLGAGASIPFGFPSGKKLVKQICDMLKDDSNNIYRLFLILSFPEQIVRDFRRALSLSGQSSVDAFLEHRTEFINVGKTAIATALLPFEKTKRLFNLGMDENWYQYLFGVLNTSFEEFGENNLSIITFNYDRSMEYYLFSALKNAHGRSDKECAEKLSSIPIIHVHGKLGDFEWEPDYRFPVPYDLKEPLETDMVERASKKIKIIHENIAEDSEFKQAHQLLSEAARVYFLGFGFNQTNLERLQIESLPTDKCIWGTGLGLSLQQKIELGRFNISTLKWSSKRGNPNQIYDVDVYKFLHDHATLD